MPAVTLQQAFEFAFQHHRAGRLPEAEMLYRQILSARPDDSNVMHALGIVVLQTGRHNESIEWIRQAIEREPKNPAAHSHLGEAYRACGRLDEAVAAYERAIELQPDLAEAWSNLGNARREQGALGQAITAYRRAVRLQPDFANAHHNLGLALAQHGDFAEAIAAYRRVLAIQPTFPEARYNLSVALAEHGQLDEAMVTYRAARELHPGPSPALNNLGVALVRQGQLDDAVAVFRHTLELQPDDADVHSNLIHALHLQPASDENIIAAEHYRWNQRICEPLKRSIPPHPNDRHQDRRLRIGYVSRDFCAHPIAFFLTPMLEARDRDQFEIYCYSDVVAPDAVTERLHKTADVWRDVRRLSHEQLARRVREDAIDLLVDLGMHTGGNRLPVFARRPAPIQISWLAYPGSTGVDGIGFRLSDPRLDPESEQPNRAQESIIRLPDAWCCYAPVAKFPTVGPLPASTSNVVTFGSLNQFCKISDELVRSWCALLQRLPSSHLRMICPPGQAADRLHALFTAQGIGADRVDLIKPSPWLDYVRLFAGIDIALDSFPCNGMTTTCHALWMGVPVVSRAGARTVSRAGSSVLHAAGLLELVAHSADEYVNIAADLGSDLARLTELRRTLRSHLEHSSLMDAPRFTRHLEAAFRTLWRQWCEASRSF